MLVLRVGRRGYASAVSPTVKLVAELRRRTEISISRAREALAATNNDLHAAEEWLSKDLAGSGASKAAKLQHRDTGDGVVAVSILSPGYNISGPSHGVRAAMIELNCETDFVARNHLLRRLAADIAHTAAFLSEEPASGPFNNCDLDMLHDAPLLSSDNASQHSARGTVAAAIRDTMVKVGEKVTLRRGTSALGNPAQDASVKRVASYIHGSVGDDTNVGRTGTLVLLGVHPTLAKGLSRHAGAEDDFLSLERSLARQVVGLHASRVGQAPQNDTNPDPESDALYQQPFMTYPSMSDLSVQTALSKWPAKHGLDGSIHVLDFVQWSVGSM